MSVPEISYQLSPPLENHALNTLFAAAWAEHTPRDFQNILHHSLLWVCAYNGERLIGFVNVAWDGGKHGFILDTTVLPDFQQQGIGGELVQRALENARQRGIEWAHVDYEAHLEAFYRKCGFHPTRAGLLNLQK